MSDTLSASGFFEQVTDFVLRHGQEALDAMGRLDSPDALMLERLVDRGLLDKSHGQYQLTARAVVAMQRQALLDVFGHLVPGGQGRSQGESPAGDLAQRGSAISETDLMAALQSALARNVVQCPIQVDQQDLERYLADCRCSASIAVLLDMSGSMARFGRFYAAKKVTMALYALIRQRFGNDTVDVIGYYSMALPISENELPALTPKTATVLDSRAPMLVPLSAARTMPQHFTNLQMALRLARDVLARRGGENKLAFIITDGEPTAHLEGEQVVLMYPPGRQTADATLAEALTLSRAGVRLATFALIDDYYHMDWVGFVDQMTRLTRGVSFYCGSSELAGCVIESYLAGKKGKVFAG